MVRRRSAVLLTWLLGSFACGGNAFSTGENGGGTTDTTGAAATTGPGTTSTMTTTGSSGGAGGATDTVGSTTGTPASSTTGTAGGRFDGGSGGAGGQPVDAGSDATACDLSQPLPVTFRLRVQSGSDYCTNACGAPWVSIYKTGSDQPLVISRGCTTDCSQCQPVACPAIACIAPQHVPHDGETLTWDGTAWQSSKCGPQNLTCTSPTCGTPPGRYIARMCAYKAASDAGPYCMAVSAITCVDVPFEYPTSSAVEGTLP